MVHFDAEMGWGKSSYSIASRTRAMRSRGSGGRMGGSVELLRVVGGRQGGQREVRW